MSKLEQFLKIKNMTKTSADLYFYGDIVSDWMDAWSIEDKYPEEIRRFLNEANGKDLNIYINSGGGSVFAGMAIYNMLKRHPGHKKVVVDGLAASISSVIALVGDEIEIPSNAYFMIHKPWSYCQGDAEDFKTRSDMLNKLEEGIISVYEENLADGTSVDDIKNMMSEETWMTGEEASKIFNNITAVSSLNVLNCASDMEFKNRPKNLTNKKVDEELENLALEIELL